MADNEFQELPSNALCPECIQNNICSELTSYSIDMDLMVFLCPKANCTYPLGSGAMEAFCVKYTGETKVQENTLPKPDGLAVPNETSFETLTKVKESNPKVDVNMPLTFYQNEVKKQPYIVKSNRNHIQGKRYNHLLF